MSEFFSWGQLATSAGAVLCVTMITQFTKGLRFIERIPTRVWSYAIAVTVLVLAEIFAGTPSVQSVALCAINAIVVALAAQGAYDAMN